MKAACIGGGRAVVIPLGTPIARESPVSSLWLAASAARAAGSRQTEAGRTRCEAMTQLEHGKQEKHRQGNNREAG